MSMTCFGSFLRLRGQILTRAHLTTNLAQVGDLMLLRRFAPNLEELRGKFVICCSAEAAAAAAAAGTAAASEAHSHAHRRDEFGDDACQQARHLSQLSPFSAELPQLLQRHPMSRLRTVDVEGRLTVLAMQLMAGAADALEALHVNNSPPLSPPTPSPSPPSSAEAAAAAAASPPSPPSPSDASKKAMSDDWLEALVRVNSLRSLKYLTFRLDSDQTVESGSFSERGLLRFLGHCLDHGGQRLTDLVGEFTRIPDKTLQVGQGHPKTCLRRMKKKKAAI